MPRETNPAPDPISPELALVDPELAERARRDLSNGRGRLRSELQAGGATAERRVPTAAAPRAVYMPRPERTVIPAPPPPAAPRLPAGRRRSKWSRRRRVALALIVVYALVGWIAYRIARHQLHRSPTAQRGKSVAAQAEAPAPTGGKPSIPTTIARSQRPRTFVWVPVRGSTFYEMRLFRHDVEIFEARTTAARLTLPQTWRYGGKRHRLGPGTYRWLVLPGYGSRDHPRYGAPVVSAELRVGR